MSNTKNIEISFEEVQVITQKSKDQIWHDEQGMAIPYKYISPVQRMHEKHTAKILKGALDIEKRLKSFKIEVSTLCQEAYDAFMESKNVTASTKGNYVWYNFNRTIKIEVSVKEPIQFDELTITAAKNKFDEFLESALNSNVDFVKQMIKEAFETTKKTLDTKRVLSLLKYKNKVKNPLFTEAAELIEQAIRHPTSKRYFRVWKKDTEGEYQAINLNFSSVKK